MRQVICIHGGETHASYEEYLAMLRLYTIDPYTDKKRWRDNLQDDLGDAYAVLLPLMPNKYNSRYAEWEIWFDKYLPFLEDGCIFIGHSLGGIFLARYLATHTLPITPGALYMISAPFFTQESTEVGDFTISSEILTQLAVKLPVVLVHSQDDTVVPFEQYLQYSKALMQARSMIFEDRGHFLQEHFPELVTDIKERFRYSQTTTTDPKK